MDDCRVISRKFHKKMDTLLKNSGWDFERQALRKLVPVTVSSESIGFERRETMQSSQPVDL